MIRTNSWRSQGVALFALAALACQGSSAPKGGRTVLLSEEIQEAEDDEDAARRRRQQILITRGDEDRVGAEAARQVEQQMGLLGDPELATYVQELGDRLGRAVPRTSRYEFRIVDDVQPNAFALPGGHIYVSRGLLALASSEDELANVVGHEITHSARRHASRLQAIQKAQPLLALPWVQAGSMASYSRDMEREADTHGQRIAAAAGYDPAAMATFLAKLEQSQRLVMGYTRLPWFFDTHPGTRERVGVNAIQAREIRWSRDPSRGDTRQAFLERIDGLPFGPRPEAGLFEGRRFIHPVMDFQLLFPPGWTVSNSGSAVGAQEPHGDAVIFLEAEAAHPSVVDAALAFLDQAPRGSNLRDDQAVTIGGLDGWRIELSFPGPGGQILGMVTWIDRGDVIFRISAMCRMSAAKRFRGRMLAAPRSLRRLTEAQKNGIRATRIRLVEARPGEALRELATRTDSELEPVRLAVLNGVALDHRFEGGETIKIARDEAWSPAAATGGGSAR